MLAAKPRMALEGSGAHIIPTARISLFLTGEPDSGVILRAVPS